MGVGQTMIWTVLRFSLRSRILLVAVWVASLFFESAVVATDRWYSDAETRSANGRFVATSRSPENRKSTPGPFQTDFTFTLRDTIAKKVLWRFEQPSSEPGGALFVSDSGDVARLGVYSSLWLFRRTGERIMLGNVLEIVGKPEVERYCDDTTAGVFWSQFSWDGFHRTATGKDYFYVRTYWGRRIVVDVARGRITNEKSVHGEIERTVLAQAIRSLQIPETQLWEKCSSCGGMHFNEQLKRSVFVLEQHKIRGRERLIGRIAGKDDGHVHSVGEHLSRVRKHCFVK